LKLNAWLKVCRSGDKAEPPAAEVTQSLPLVTAALPIGSSTTSADAQLTISKPAFSIEKSGMI
tara:strand:- start:2392 stop:2580 length:189 start_codon:yes stop_codon:yes gene_type:complete